MDCEVLSDLEEGEILEYESLSPSDRRSDGLEIKGRHFDSFKKENKNWHFDFNKSKGHINRSLKDKVKFSKELESTKSNLSMIDLESISSEEDCRTEEEGKYFASETKDYAWNNKERKAKGKHSTYFYGAVEDIMSEIGETICRKTRCNYKKRKSKDSHYSLYKYKDNSYDLWRHKIFSSHLKSKKHKRKISFSDSDSELKKDRSNKRKKRIKRREVYYNENEKDTKKPLVKDFDEMRQNLLEKLKKQKAEEESKALLHKSTMKEGDSEIQVVDMIIDCTDYVGNPPDAAPEISENEEWRTEEKNGEDELDLIKLRLIALASNKNKKVSEPTLKTENSENLSEKKNFTNSSREDVDLDRNELLLRAEALKTALLKKHQKRLSKMKIKKLGGIEKSSDNAVANFLSSSVEKNTKVTHLEKNTENIDGDAFKENVEKCGNKTSEGFSDVHILNTEMKMNNMNEAVISNASPKKMHSRTRCRRKKRKSGSFANNLKENSEKSETLEEDDKTLRSQLLSDLMKKKSLKDLEKKSVLMDSIQTSANKNPLSVKSTETPKENTKPSSVVKKNLLKKVNVPKKTKPIAPPPIPKPEIQRIIIHLGSDDSSDDGGSSFQASRGLAVPEEHPSLLKEKDKEGNESSFVKSSHVDKKENKLIPADYEKSVELLLNQARKKIEGKKQVAVQSTLAAPEAVYKHLPLSQRLEYMRLKQKIAERERLKNQKKENFSKSFLASGTDSQPLEISTTTEKECISETSTPKLENVAEADLKKANSSSSNSSLSKTDSCLPHSSSNIKIFDGFSSLNELKTKETDLRSDNNKIGSSSGGVYSKCLKECVAEPGNKKKTAVPAERNTLLLPFSQALLTKLKLLLKKIKIEKMIEENYEKEISKLKNQLSLFEKKKGEQRFKIKKLGEESIKTYKAIQGITTQSKEKAILMKDEWKEEKRDGVGCESEHIEKKLKEGIALEEEKEEGMKVPKEPNTEISKVNNAPSKIDEVLKNDDEINETVANGKSSSIGLLEYHSPLQIFNKVSNCSEKVDPNVMMCQFDLMGICKDEECAYQHLRTS